MRNYEFIIFGAARFSARCEKNFLSVTLKLGAGPAECEENKKGKVYSPEKKNKIEKDKSCRLKSSTG